MNIFFEEKFFSYIESKVRQKKPSYSIKDRISFVIRKSFGATLLILTLYAPYFIYYVVTLSLLD